MSQENVEIVQRMYEQARDAYYRRIEALHEAHESGDFGEFLAAAEELLDPDFVLTPPEDSPFPEAGTREWRGREGFLRFVAGQSEGFEAMSLEPEEFIDAGDRVVVPLQFGGQARYTGIEVKFAVVHVVTIRDGKAARLDIYTSRAKALEAAGLRESGVGFLTVRQGWQEKALVFMMTALILAIVVVLVLAFAAQRLLNA